MQNEELQVIVTVDDQHQAGIDSIAQALTAAGMKIENVLRTGGIITGRVPKSLRSNLNAVEGVAAIENDSDVRAI